MRVTHIAWNLSGLLLPICVAALTVPTLVEHLGQERFGLLALAWGLIGYASALDLGLGRALTQMAASCRGRGEDSTIPDILATASRITLLTGLLAGIIISLFALCGGSELINTLDTPKNEIQLATLMLAIALPAQAMSATYKGLNEAFMNFKGISLLRAMLGVINFAGPYIVSLFTIKLPWLILTLVVSRMAVVCFALGFILPFLLPVWIGKNLNNTSIIIGQILCVGVFANSIGSMYYSVIHATGRADLTAKAHMVELPIYIISLIILGNLYGIVGVALAWSGRMLVDTIILSKIYLSKNINYF